MGTSDHDKKEKVPPETLGKKKSSREVHTSFGEPVKVFYGPEDLADFDPERDLGGAWRLSVYPRDLPHHVPQPALDHAALQRHGHG